MKQSQETCQFFNNPFMTCDVRVGYMNRVVPTFYIVQERNGANEEDYFGEEYFINAVSHQ